MRFIPSFTHLTLVSSMALFAVTVHAQGIPKEFHGKWAAIKDASGVAYSAQEQAKQCRSGFQFSQKHTDIYPLEVSASKIEFASYVAGYELKVIKIISSRPGDVQGIGNASDWEEGADPDPNIKRKHFRLERNGDSLIHTYDKNGRFYFKRCTK